MVSMKARESESVKMRIRARERRLKHVEEKIAYYTQMQENSPSLLYETELANAKADKANISVELTFLERERALLLARKENTNEQTNGPQPGNDN